MKKGLLIAVLLLCALLLAGCPGQQTPPTPTPPPDDPTLPTVYSVKDEFPKTDGVWKYFSVTTNNTTITSYTALSQVSEQTSLGAAGFTAAGTGVLGKESAIAASGQDVAYGFCAPRDGRVTLSSEMLQRDGSGNATVTVYKNGIRIWPVAIDGYTATTTNKAALLSVKTAVKAGDMLFVRISAGGETAGKLMISPVVTYEKGVAYDVKDDREATPLTYTAPAEGVGNSLAADSLALTGRAPSDTPISMTSDEFFIAMSRKALTPGATYKITDSKHIEMELPRGSFDAQNCIAIIPGGMTLIVKENTVFSNLTVITDAQCTVKGGKNVTLSGVEMTGGLLIDASCEGILLDQCRISASDVALKNTAASITVTNSYFAGKTALQAGSEVGGLYENCVFYGEDTAITLSGESTTVWYSTIRGDVSATGTNLLIAMNRFENLGGVQYDHTHNSVVLLNEINHVQVVDSTNAYVCSNTVTGALTFQDVNYLLATRNALLDDRVTLTETTNFNGDSVTDVDARAEVGANEDLLPHVNKDAYINMERKAYVRTADGNTKELDDYINAKVQSNGLLIIAPGAYSCDSRIVLKNIKDCTVYAYGVLYEKDDFFDDVLNITSCENLSFRGMTIDMVLNGCGHMIVLEKKNGAVTYRAAAGMLQDVADTYYFTEGGNGIAFMGYRADESFPYADIAIGPLSYSSVTGLMTSVPSEHVYNMLEPGDMLTCRANGGNVANLHFNKSLAFEDFNVWSGSIRCFWDHGAIEGTSLNRVTVTPAPAKKITKETYDEYRALEEDYGVSLGVYVDDDGNYRGTPARTVTADSTHTTDSQNGMKVTSTIFEGLSDDATNHQGSHGRVAGFDPATGVLTYKQNVCTLGYTAVCYPFTKGERVYIYSSTGQLLCDSAAVSDTVELGVIDGYKHYQVTIDPEQFNYQVLENYSLDSNAAADPKVLIDNRSHNGDGFYYDNVVAQNIRSRGFLVKCGDNVINNCTFRNIGMAAVALMFELEWGESGVCDNTVVSNNLFENTGYFNNVNIYSPITVVGLGQKNDDAFLPYHDITITGNKVVDRATDYALYINSARDVIVANNDFGTRYDEHEYQPYPSVFVNYAKDVAFDNNTYSPYLTDITEQIVAIGHMGITGSDIDGKIEDDITSSNAAHSSSMLENMPASRTDDKGNSILDFTGPWAFGWTSLSSPLDFQPYRVLTDSSWYAESENKLWSSSGGIRAHDFRFAALKGSNVAFRYTAEHSGKALVQLSMFAPPLGSGEGSGIGAFAIFVNDQMVWPTEGGSYSSSAGWYRITQDTSVLELRRELSGLELDLEKGDQVFFVSKRLERWSAFTAVPSIYYSSVEE